MTKFKLLAVCVLLAGFAQAKLVARWDFNNFNSADPTSTNVLAATVGDAAYPCYYAGNKGSALVTDGTLGQMYMAYASSSDSTAVTAFNALGANNYAIAIPSRSHIALPIPDAVKNHPFTIKIRCWIPSTGWRCFFNRNNTTDGDLFMTPAKSNRTTNGIGGGFFAGYNSYKKAIGLGSWQTVTVSAGANRFDVFLNETTEATYNSGVRTHFFADSGEALTTYNGKQCLLLCADEDGEDGLMYVDYVELFDTAAAYEGRLPHYTKDGLVGEWTFPTNNPLKATVGQDLEYYTRTGSKNFASRTDGVMPGDSTVRKGVNNSFKCYHGLPANSSYTLVMDVRILTTANYHALFQPTSANNTDSPIFLYNKGNGGNNFWFKWSGRNPESTVAAVKGEWRRIVITHNGAKTTNNKNDIGSYAYSNGVYIDWNGSHNGEMTAKKGGYWLLLGDDDGEDNQMDISYAAIYDRMLSTAEIQELHSRPLAQNQDESFIPTVAPAGIWQDTTNAGTLTALKGESLTKTSDGGYTWARSSAPTAATYVFDLKLPATQTAGGTLVKNSSNVASGIYGTGSAYSGSFTTTTDPANFLSNTSPSTWGYWSENALDRSTAHRLAVVWAKQTGLVHYYVDGEAWGQIFPNYANTANAPTATMSFLNGLGATVTQVKAYDVALTPDEVAGLGSISSDNPRTAPVPTISHNAVSGTTLASATITFTVSATQAEGEYVSYDIDYGDGTTHGTTGYLASGASTTFSHVYGNTGPYTATITAISQSGAVGTAQTEPFTLAAVTKAATDVLATWPWQQNVYTNRFTIMCEAKAYHPGFELQWGADYANRTEMSYVVGNGSTYIYKAHITVPDELIGTQVPYRLGFCGLALTSTEATNDTAGVVKLWTEDANASFTCAIWGDNQQGARSGDWDSDIYRYVRALFTDMVARDVDFGISTGDMASSADYSNQIKPGVLVATDGILGRTRPYYVAWGNHDTSYPNNKPYFETVAVDDPSYLSSEKGNGYLYRNNVLFIFIDQQLHATAATKTWLANVLATERAQAAKFRILIHHYPVYGECWGSLNQYLLDTIKSGNVDLVFSGHMHGYERIEKDGFIQLTNGGAGYLDHVEDIVNNYGEATKVGGHQNVPYLWARQKSKTETAVLGPAEPVRMGCIQSYGELKVEDNVLTYRAHGFNADGSYIGVFDAFAVTSKVVTATSAATAATATYCADNSSFAEFTTKPVTNAKWSEYKTAIGESFTYPEGAENAAVVNVTKTEIEAFCAWLNGENGANGTYRLPTLAELQTTFGETLARDVSEWTSTVDPLTGWCRILGGNTNAVAGTWCRAEDQPAIATADCHANYLGFRLATGAAPAEPVSPLAAPLAALAAIETPAEVYAWQDGALVDITSEWRTDAPTAHSYDVPVIFTGTGSLTYTNNNAVAFNAGFAAPNSTEFKNAGTGALTIKGAVKGGETTSAWGWCFTTGGTLAIEGVTFTGQSCGFASGNRTLSLKGTNDFSGATMPFGTGNNRVTNLVATAGATLLKTRALRDYTATQVVIGKDVTVTASEDLRVDGAFTWWIDGQLDVNGANVQNNVDPRYLGEGTLKTTSFGSYQNSYQYLGISNVVLNSGNPWRTNNNSGDHPKYYISGSRVRLTSLYPWTLNLVDTWNVAFQFISVTLDGTVPHLVIAGDQTVHFNPTTCNVALEVEGGTTLVKKLPTSSTTATSATGAWGADTTLALSAGQTMTGAFVAGGTLSYTFGTAIAAGDWPVLYGTGRAAGDITVTTDADTTKWLVTELWNEAGDLTLRVQDASTPKIAVWTNAGDRTNPLDPANWCVTNAGAVVAGAVPDAATAILVSGATAMNVPATDGFAYGSLIISEKVELAADCDWTALTNVVLAANSVIDLKGHQLTLSNVRAALSGKGTITDSTTDADHPGELHLNIPSGTTYANTTVAFTGNFKLVKEGAGIYTANYDPGAAGYTGGTDVLAGTARPGNPVGNRFGAWGTTIDVAAGATFDLWSRVMSQYNFRLNGCTFQNTLNASDATSELGNFELTADQTFNYTSMSVDNSIAVVTNTVWNLGGHTFSIGISSGRYLRLRGPHSLTNGTLNITTGGWFETNTLTNDCRTVNLIVNCAFNLTQPLSVRDYTAKYGGAGCNNGTAALNVNGVFTPVSTCFYGATMQDGSTINLASKTNVWSTTSAFTEATTGLKTLSFADNATVGIDLGKRTFKTRTQIVSWTTAPTNLATLKFVSANAKLFVESDGIYAIQSGLLIILK